MRPAHDDGVHPGASDHGDLAGERGDEPAPPPPAHGYDDRVGNGHAAHESSERLSRAGDRYPWRIRDPETQQQHVPGGECGEGAPEPEEGDRIDRARRRG